MSDAASRDLQPDWRYLYSVVQVSAHLEVTEHSMPHRRPPGVHCRPPRKEFCTEERRRSTFGRDRLCARSVRFGTRSERRQLEGSARVPPLKVGQNSAQAAVAALWRALA